ncbi:MAG: ABC transporter ATP-binding protein [Synechococcales cyanobacterium]
MSVALPCSVVETVPAGELQDIHLGFASVQGWVQVLQRINLTIHPGEFVCVLGASGCGKTSLLRILAGYQKPVAGLVRINGQPHTKPSPEVGVVFQSPNLFPWLTIARNVEFGPQMRGIPKLERQALVQHYLQMVGLADVAQRLPHHLSGGMRQRAAIARTLAANPVLMLMDEPFAALDALTRRSMQAHLQKLWRQTEKTILLITHDVEEALLLATRIVVMGAAPGRILRDQVSPLAHTSITEDVVLSHEFIALRQSLITTIRDAS